MAIGGYFGLEIAQYNQVLHEDALYLNTARNCLEYILLAQKYQKIYVPSFTCEVLLEPIKKHNISLQFYDVDYNLEPIFDYHDLKANEVILLTNYFGLKTDFIRQLVARLSQVIVDNSQALFTAATPGIDTFYSPRKFVGIPDGGILRSKAKLNRAFDQDESYGRMAHLLKRVDLSAEEGYQNFIINDKLLSHQPILEMSNITRTLLNSIDYPEIARIRRANYTYLQEHLSHLNMLDLSLGEQDVPLVYPLRVKKADLYRKQLGAKNIYCATYWPIVLEWCCEAHSAYWLTKEIIPLPIDQRYGLSDMKFIADLILTTAS